MSEVHPDVLAQMKRIWSAVNDGTLDRDTVNDALRVMHDLLTGAAYEGNDGPSGSEPETTASEDDAAPARKPRKKR